MSHFRRALPTLLALIVAVVGLAPRVAHAVLWSDHTVSGNVVYFLYAAPSEILRYDMAADTWLPPIALPERATTLAVDGDGIYLGMGNSVRRLNLDGTGLAQLTNTSREPQGLVLDGDSLFVAIGSEMRSIDKNAGTLISAANYFYTLRGISISPTNNKLFGRTSGVSPSDIVVVDYDDAGNLTGQSDSRYHGAFASATRTWVFPGQGRVVDDSGTVYTTVDLTYAAALGPAIDALSFYGELPIAIRGSTLYGYDVALNEAGRLDVGTSADEIVVYGDELLLFTSGSGNAIETAKVAIADIAPLEPGEPIDPNGLVYTPDRVVIDKDDVVYLLDGSFVSVFRWSFETGEYLPSIPLVNAPSLMAYSADTHRLYLGYGDRKIRQVKLDDGLTEENFVTASSNLCGLSTAGAYVFACDYSGAWESHYTFAPDASPISAVEWNYPAQEYVWNASTRRLYFFRDGTSPNDLLSEIINPDGTIGAKIDSPEHSSTGIRYPINVRGDGALVLLGSGRLHDGISLAIVDYLPRAITDAAWVGNTLYTVRDDLGGKAIFERYTSTYAVDQSVAFEGVPLYLKETSSGLIVILDRGGIPVFVRLFPGSDDFDGDGTIDEDDAFPFDATDWSDRDADGHGDNADAFPDDPAEWSDRDGDGVGDNADRFPYDPSESSDRDLDGVGDNSDAFPDDPSEWLDSDGDGIGNNADHFPFDPNEWSDRDGDDVGDNADDFPDDGTEWSDRDGDGVGDNGDAFPDDPAESSDRDGDGVGDNRDAFPDDPSESSDRDADGVGDNADAYPDDPERTAIDYALYVGDLLVADPSVGLVKIDTSRAEQILFAHGVDFAPDGLLVTDEGDIFASSTVTNALYFVDPRTRVVSSVSHSDLLFYPAALSMGRSGELLVSDPSRGDVVSVDPLSGDQHLVSFSDAAFYSPWDAVDTAGGLFTVDSNSDAVSRTTLFPVSRIAWTEGGYLNLPSALWRETANALLVAVPQAGDDCRYLCGEGVGAVVRVDLTTRAQTLISAAAGFAPYDITSNAGSDIWVTVPNAAAVVHVDAVSGDRTEVTSGGMLTTQLAAIAVMPVEVQPIPEPGPVASLIAAVLTVVALRRQAARRR